MNSEGQSVTERAGIPPSVSWISLSPPGSSQGPLSSFPRPSALSYIDIGEPVPRYFIGLRFLRSLKGSPRSAGVSAFGPTPSSAGQMQCVPHGDMLKGAMPIPSFHAVPYVRGDAMRAVGDGRAPVGLRLEVLLALPQGPGKGLHSCVAKDGGRHGHNAWHLINV